MHNLKTNFEPSNEIYDIVRQFSDIEALNIEHSVSVVDNNVQNKIIIDGKQYEFLQFVDSCCNELIYKRNFKRVCKGAVYDALKQHLGFGMPWGSLTGIRPTKIGYEYVTENDGNVEGVDEFLVKKYDVLPKKAEIIKKILLCQAEYLPDSEQYVNLYVHIPFCVTKCSYCSFVTHIVDKCRDIISDYCDKLAKEIACSIEQISRQNQKIYSIYIGGGTPTAIDDLNLEKILSACSGHDVEFTCEAGRPDTITDSKLNLMKKYGVTRICVNPQTLNNSTLVAIGRSHSAEDFFDAYKRAEKLGFDINVDLIAGLKGESLDDFIYSYNQIVALRPANFTVHTLCIKNGSELKNSGGATNDAIDDMVEYAQSNASKNGYVPYYLYRQKQMLGNFENVGYCLNGKQCANNITTMEEILSVVGCGAGAISKRVFAAEHRIERLANLRDARLYLQDFDERLQKKAKFFQNQP